MEPEVIIGTLMAVLAFLAAARNRSQLLVETVVRTGAEFAVRDALDRSSSEVAGDAGRKSAGFFLDSGTASESARGVPICTAGRIGRHQVDFAVDWTVCSEFQKFLTRSLLGNCERSVSRWLIASDTPPGLGARQRPLGSDGVDLGFDSPLRRVHLDLEALRGYTDVAGQAVFHGRHGTANWRGERS